MTDLTKLADALENIAHMEYPSGHHDGNNLREAARILRAADAVDVGELMAMSDTSIVLACDYLMTHKESAKAKAIEHRAALESALRLALAAREGFVMVPLEPTPEMLEAGTNKWALDASAAENQEDTKRAYRAMIAAAPKGTP